MKKQTIRSGLVGAGYAASFHYDALVRVHGVQVEVVGVYDRDTERAKAFAAERGLRAFDTLEALLDEVDVVHVCVITQAHEEVTLAILAQDKYAVVEKPLTGYFGDGSDSFNGDTFPKQTALEESTVSLQRLIEAEKASRGHILYAENWIYAPAVQKEREIIEKTGAQILWIHGEQSHSGSHAPTYAYWKYSGGGVMIGKGCHPLSVALYLKRVEGRARSGQPIRPVAVSSRTHALTRLPGFRDEGHIRCDYVDIDDFSMMHVVFEDGTVADIFASDIVNGGIHEWIEVTANNHRTRCNLNPTNAMQTYNPVEANFDDIYVVEKIGTKQGWTSPSPDEDWFSGYQHEMEAFYRSAALGEAVESDSGLAADCITTIYSAYVSAERKGAEVDITRLG